MMDFFIELGEDHGDKLVQTVWFIYDINILFFFSFYC